MDEYGSGAWFSGWTAPVTRPEGDAPVIEPKTWLLTTGWHERGGGRIRRDEMPVGA